jgi:hypothetical protein
LLCRTAGNATQPAGTDSFLRPNPDAARANPHDPGSRHPGILALCTRVVNPTSIPPFRLSGLLLLFIGGLLSIHAANTPSHSDRPNILLLITDDQRFDQLGVVNPLLHTPRMDQLAREGVHFRNAFVTTPICAASRASL